MEFAGSINVRWITFPWDRYLDTSVAFGGGLSVTSEVPVLEKRDPRATARPRRCCTTSCSRPRSGCRTRTGAWWAAFTTAPGIFGLFSHSGSNVLEVGVRYRF